ncbi:MAG TPA: F0F1 ATP synthase subunit B [Candidatus Dormibacteraeota bacterium]|nr:F0F1 ATP synthase subunit B [Candidatus Dormibacteraeota bacterium]
MVADASLLEINVTFVVEVIAFVAMLLVLGRWVYPRIMAAAEARQNQIARNLADAERARQDAQAALEDVSRQIEDARAQAREIIDRAHKAAVLETEELVKKGRRDAENQLQRARSEIATERDKAIQEIRAQVGTLVVAAASRVLGDAIDSRTHSRLIEESLAQVEPPRGTGAN